LSEEKNLSKKETASTDTTKDQNQTTLLDEKNLPKSGTNPIETWKDQNEIANLRFTDVNDSIAENEGNVWQAYFTSASIHILL
jgi:hypothetical protein